VGRLACWVAGCALLACVPDLARPPRASDVAVYLDWPPIAYPESQTLEVRVVPSSDAPKPDTRRPCDVKPWPDQNLGHWYQANQKNCSAFCGTLGKSNVASPEGAYCMSGENRPTSAVADNIDYKYGCWQSCNPSACTGAQSDGIFCYRPDQTTDGDVTDFTVGCFCR
jgi:hypothetical protein